MVVDEAHSSQSGESTKPLKAILATKDLDEAEREDTVRPPWTVAHERPSVRRLNRRMPPGRSEARDAESAFTDQAEKPTFLSGSVRTRYPVAA